MKVDHKLNVNLQNNHWIGTVSEGQAISFVTTCGDFLQKKRQQHMYVDDDGVYHSRCGCRLRTCHFGHLKFFPTQFSIIWTLVTKFNLPFTSLWMNCTLSVSRGRCGRRLPARCQTQKKFLPSFLSFDLVAKPNQQFTSQNGLHMGCFSQQMQAQTTCQVPDPSWEFGNWWFDKEFQF